MPRPTTALLLCTALLFTACTTTKQTQPPPSPTPNPTGSLCERVQPVIAGKWKAEPALPRTAVPLTTSCNLVDLGDKYHRVRVSVSVVPVSAAEAIRMRTEFERDPSDGKEYAQAVFGPDSWSHRPKFAESALGFRSSGRLILMRQEERFLDDYAQLESIARSINALPGGIRPEPAVVEQPDCALGTGAAAQVLGTKVTMQRGGTAGTASFCGWGSSQATIVLHAGKSGSEPAQRFGSDVHRDAVDVGDGGHLSKPGLLEFRVGTTFVQIFGPTTKGLVELGRVMAPVYRG